MHLPPPWHSCGWREGCSGESWDRAPQDWGDPGGALPISPCPPQPTHHPALPGGKCPLWLKRLVFFPSRRNWERRGPCAGGNAELGSLCCSQRVKRDRRDRRTGRARRNRVSERNINVQNALKYRVPPKLKESELKVSFSDSVGNLCEHNIQRPPWLFFKIPSR